MEDLSVGLHERTERLKAREVAVQQEANRLAQLRGALEAQGAELASREQALTEEEASLLHGMHTLLTTESKNRETTNQYVAEMEDSMVVLRRENRRLQDLARAAAASAKTHREQIVRLTSDLDDQRSKSTLLTKQLRAVKLHMERLRTESVQVISTLQATCQEPSSAELLRRQNMQMAAKISIMQGKISTLEAALQSESEKNQVQKAAVGQAVVVAQEHTAEVTRRLQERAECLSALSKQLVRDEVARLRSERCMAIGLNVPERHDDISAVLLDAVYTLLVDRHADQSLVADLLALCLHHTGASERQRKLLPLLAQHSFKDPSHELLLVLFALAHAPLDNAEQLLQRLNALVLQPHLCTTFVVHHGLHTMTTLLKHAPDTPFHLRVAAMASLTLSTAASQPDAGCALLRDCSFSDLVDACNMYLAQFFERAVHIRVPAPDDSQPQPVFIVHNKVYLSVLEHLCASLHKFVCLKPTALAKYPELLGRLRTLLTQYVGDNAIQSVAEGDPLEYLILTIQGILEKVHCHASEE
ncbi:hypothetical protein RI367_004411 [Sorochytrium milnesiophthora]